MRADQLAGRAASCLTTQLYLEWGLQDWRLTIDGNRARPKLLIEKGPEDLAREIARAVQAETGLYGRRKKKLLIAFHFQFSSPAAWNCDTCR